MEFDEIVVYGHGNEQYRQLILDNIMIKKYGIDKREFMFTFDDNEHSDNSRLASEKSSAYPAVYTEQVELFLSGFGEKISKIRFHCPVENRLKRRSKFHLLQLVQQYLTQLKQLTFVKCSPRDLNFMQVEIESVENMHLNSSQLSDTQCQLPNRFPGLKTLTVEIIGESSFKCIEDKFPQLNHFELIDQQAELKLNKPIEKFFALNPNIKHVTLSGIFDLDAMAEYFKETEILQLNAASEDFFNKNEADLINLPSLKSLIIESDSDKHYQPQRLPFSFNELWAFTLYRRDISNEWCKIIGDLKTINNLFLPNAILNETHLQLIFGQLPKLVELSVQWDRQNEKAITSYMNKNKHLEIASFVGLNMNNVLQRKVILRQLDQEWRTINDATTVEHITTFKRNVDFEDDSSEEADEETPSEPPKE